MGAERGVGLGVGFEGIDVWVGVLGERNVDVFELVYDEFRDVGVCGRGGRNGVKRD